MSYQAIYRKFRPRVFDDVLGQEHITTILKNQILSDNIAHAYLFSGTRGTGKTSTARIFARAINCIDICEGNPCNKCSICKGILEESIMDIVEIDAASNNSVEDIRELRENSKYPPSNCKYKVYIIDEVHMLSKGAFNALLKILEEPPKHLIFILATTEPQRLPATIISRCQRYDFKRVMVDDIVKNMEKICDEVGISVEKNALDLIARNSDGAMRDALSILDQCLSFTDGSITYEYVLSTLGIANDDLLFQTVDHILDSDINGTVDDINTIIQNGIDTVQFIKDMVNHFRNIMMVKTSTKLENIIDGSNEYIERLKQQAEKIDLNRVISFLNILSEAENKSKWSTQSRIILEVSIIKMIKMPQEQDIASLIDKVNKLEKDLESGTLTIAKSSTRQQSVPKVQVEERKQTNTEDNKPKSTNKNPSSNIDSSIVSKEWTNILNKIRKEKIGLHALIMEGKIVSCKNNIITISFNEGFAFHRDALDKKENKESVENIISDYLNSNIELRLVMNNEDTEEDNEQEIKEMIKEVVDVFGEDLVEIEE